MLRDAQSPEKENAAHGNDVSDDVRPSHNDVKSRTSSDHGKSSSPSSSSPSSPSRRAVSASSSEDLFDDEPPKTAGDGAADRRRVPGDLTTSTDGDAVETSRQPVSCSSHRPTSTAQPLTSKRGTSRPTTAHVATFQITPTLRQRAFPRTNPAYIGTYRRDRPPTYRRVDCPTTSLGVASELRPSTSPHNGTRRPSSDGLQRALIQHTGDVVYLSNAAARRGGHQCTTVVTHQRFHDWTSTTTGVGGRPSSVTHQRFHDWTSTTTGVGVRPSSVTHQRFHDWTSTTTGVGVRPSSVTHQRFHDRTSTTTGVGVRPSVTLHDWTSTTTGVGVRPSSDSGASSALRLTECRSFVGDSATPATGSVNRRQSEPDYVNITARHHLHHHHAQQHPTPVSAAGRQYVDDSEWASRSQLVPSAIYMNQHELTIAGRYTSRSTCNFMDPTANGNTVLNSLPASDSQPVPTLP